MSTFANIGGSNFSGHTFALVAQVMGTRSTDGFWTVHLNGKISTNSGATGDNFDYGIRLSYLKSALGATGTLSLVGGNYATYKSDGTLAATENLGYAGALIVSGDFLRLGRYTSISGGSGSWPASTSAAAVNNLIYATIILRES